MTKKDFKEKVDAIIYAETPEIQAKLINSLYKEMSSKNNEIVGKKLTLVEKPDGYTSQHYNVEVGKKYKVVGIDGCCYRVETSDGVATINADRFSK